MLKKVYHCECGLAKCFHCCGKARCQMYRMLDVDEEEEHDPMEDDEELKLALKDLKRIFESIDEDNENN